jgi:hypothetical protein
MSLPTWLPDWLTPALELGRTQQFGLAFLLGSFAVATWSDLRRLSAQREFARRSEVTRDGSPPRSQWACPLRTPA